MSVLLPSKRTTMLSRRKDDYKTQSLSGNAKWKESDIEKKQILCSLRLLTLLRKDLGDCRPSAAKKTTKRPPSKRIKIDHEAKGKWLAVSDIQKKRNTIHVHSHLTDHDGFWSDLIENVMIWINKTSIQPRTLSIHILSGPRLSLTIWPEEGCGFFLACLKGRAVCSDTFQCLADWLVTLEWTAMLLFCLGALQLHHIWKSCSRMSAEWVHTAVFSVAEHPQHCLKKH